MKPIYLKMTAFASYCATAEVDFTRLYENGIFLITGKTGGGKTTILDAICTALYGEATGRVRGDNWRQFRCIDAPDSRDTEIEYVFSVGETKYKFYRRWHMPNSRKDSPELKDAEDYCQLQRPDSDSWETIVSGSATGVRNAAEKIIGLTHDQFIKLIMLPQGEFRELLTADDKKKIEIFSKLFDTERWKTVIDSAKAKARELEKLCEQTESRRQFALSGAGCASADELDAQIGRIRADIALLERQSADCAKKLTASSDELGKGRELAGLFDERQTALTALSRLESDAERYNALNEKLGQSRRLRGALPEYNMMLNALETEKSSVDELTRSETAKAQADSALGQAQQKSAEIPALEAKRNELLSVRGNLEDLAKKRADHDRTSNDLKKHTEELRDIRKQAEELDTKKRQMEESIARGNAFVMECQTASEALPEAIRTRDRIKKALDTAMESEAKNTLLTEVNGSMAKSEELIHEKEDELSSQQKSVEAMERAILSDRAYSLATELREGAPCPVCGSTHHPAPARPADATPTSRQLEICRKLADKTANELQQLKAQHSALAAKQELLIHDISLLHSASDEEPDNPSELRSEYGMAEKKCGELEALARKAAPARAKIEKLNADLNAVLHDIERLTIDANNLGNRITADKSRLESLDERLTSHGIAGFNELDKRLADAGRQIKSIDDTVRQLTEAFQNARNTADRTGALLEKARENHAKAAADSQTRKAAFAGRCAMLGIPTESDFRGVLSEKDEADCEKVIKEYNKNLDIVRSRIGELTGRIAGRERPDISLLEKIHNGAVSESRELSAQTAQKASQLETMVKYREMAAQAEQELRQLEKRYAVAQEMSDLLSNRNISKMSIDRYVIGIKMDEIIIQANQYLRRLSRGQYAMKRIEGGTNKINQALSIEILDGSTGGVRSVSTLSGGEMFLASLALAFGLSETVQSFAGGIHLDSLFIDEGFGSLDTETLDTAMEAITRVRENRLLGIISHVSELQERIPYGIEVVKDKDGSSLRLRT
jgi:ATPase involved in DNA repair